jgi:hypothetical protein
MLERGIERGEFRNIDIKQAMNVVCAPMIMLLLWKHSFGALGHGEAAMSPEKYLNSFIDLLLHGVLKPAAMPSS